MIQSVILLVVHYFGNFQPLHSCAWFTVKAGRLHCPLSGLSHIDHQFERPENKFEETDKAQYVYDLRPFDEQFIYGPAYDTELFV